MATTRPACRCSWCEVLEGPRAGQRIEAVVQDGSASIPGSSTRAPYEAGDEVVVTSFTGPAGGAFAVITEPWRLPLIGLVAAVFAIAVVVVGGCVGCGHSSRWR